MSDLSDFLGKIRNIQSLMVQVSTGRANIEQKEPEYQKLREALTKDYSKFGISDPNSFASLWDFYGYWRTKLPTYQARRVFIRDMYEKLENTIQSAINGKEDTIQLPSRNSEFMLCNPIFKGRNFALQKDLCFVLMPFRPNFKRLYEEHIRPVLEKADFRILKADDLYTTSAIVEDIWEYINKARFIIADVTSRNPNVFYELGIAHTLGKETVILTQNEEDIPFNLSHLRRFKYDDNELGWESLRMDLHEIVTLIKSKPMPVRDLSLKPHDYRPELEITDCKMKIVKGDLNMIFELWNKGTRVVKLSSIEGIAYNNEGNEIPPRAREPGENIAIGTHKLISLNFKHYNEKYEKIIIIKKYNGQTEQESFEISRYL